MRDRRDCSGHEDQETGHSERLHVEKECIDYKSSKKNVILIVRERKNGKRIASILINESNSEKERKKTQEEVTYHYYMFFRVLILSISIPPLIDMTIPRDFVKPHI